ncbi:MAG TPA: hypothetical protein VHG51_13030, partial [Longimicrobiaceae bacterium]|nr:hypothetical protein [Longimicrobiaceae bacterium]
MYLRTAVVPLVALGIALAPGGGAAQDGRPVPAELVRALFTGWMEGPLVVGELPEGFPAGAVPPGSRVLGGYAGARTATAAVVVPAAPDSALAA